MLVQQRFQPQLVRSQPPLFVNQNGELLKAGKTKWRLKLVAENMPELEISAKLVKNRKFLHIKHPTLLTGHSVLVHDGFGNEFTINVKSTANRLHLSEDQVRKMTQDGDIKGLVRQAERLKGIIQQMQLNGVDIQSYSAMKFFEIINTAREDNNLPALKAKLGDVDYLIDKNGQFVDIFRYQAQLGHGGFGVVHSLLDISDSSSDEVAMKQVNKNLQVNPEDVKSAEEDLVNERKMLKILNPDRLTPGIQFPPYKMLRILNSGRDEVCYMAFKYNSHLEKEIKRLVNEASLPGADQSAFLQTIYCYMYQLSAGLKHMHQNKVIHGDIKPENIFVHGDLAHIADFGGATTSVDHRMDHFVHTPGFCPKSDMELLYQKSCSKPRDDQFIHQVEEKRDVFAMGLVFYAMLDNFHVVPPYDKEDENGYMVANDQYHPIQNELVSERMKSLIQNMLHPDCHQRISALEAYEELDQILTAECPDAINQFLNAVVLK